jgi:hypothetical protein
VPDEADLRGRLNPDGSVEVWARGKRIRFPGDGQEPEVTEQGPPDDVSGMPKDVRSDVSASMTTVSYDGWYVRFGAAKVTIRRTLARVDRGVVYSRDRNRGR